VPVPFYDRPPYERFQLGSESVHMMKVVEFLRDVIRRDQLAIADYLERMGQDPFFLVAATGLGKTVAVPLHVFIRLIQHVGQQPNPEPRVWVVEPRIPIAVDQCAFMNSLWFKFLKRQQKGPKRLPPLFGSISSRGNVNPKAPIKFVTTGIFDKMARSGELTPSRDRVIIDEAHVTVEQNAGVELGIALARKAGVPVDYMSATVDTTTLTEDLHVGNIIRADRQRYVVWKHNLFESLREALPQLVKSTLIETDLSSPYYPDDSFRQANEVRTAVAETGRAHGLLAVVNSYAGEGSDIRRLADSIRRTAPEVPVLELAGEVVRDERRITDFKRRLGEIEAARQNYVILATSVVEMGITFPTLDYVVTMDSGYDQQTIGDQTFPVVAPLGVNSLLQRIGRVGRRRPGIAYISNEVGAEYADLDDDELNRNGLRYEPIRFPLISAPLTDLAYYACKQGVNDLQAWVADLDLPSRLHENADRMEYLREQIEMLEALGIAAGGRLTDFGAAMEEWIGQADLAYAVQLQRRFDDQAGLPELMFWVVATALSNTPLRTLRAQHDFFVDYLGEHDEIPHEIDVWSGFAHEDIAAFTMFCHVAQMVPLTLFAGSGLVLDDWDEFELRRWCNLSGIDGKKLLKAAAAITDLWKLFGKINGDKEYFRALFDRGSVALLSLPWASLRADLPIEQVHQELVALPGATTVRVWQNEQGKLTWADTRHGHSGLIHQDDTPLRVEEGTYFARLVPARSSKDEPTTWQLAHLGIRPEPSRRLSASRAVASRPKKSWWKRLFG
jgi:hypothetical protein